MLLVHKPMPALSFAHRRLPSAPPTLAVRPTTTPGLLSISNNKPIHANLKQQASSTAKLPRKRTHHHHHQPSRDSLTAAAPTVPSPQPHSPDRRGRKDTATRKHSPPNRSTSQHVSTRNLHQPSPTPLVKPSARNPESDTEPSSVASKSVPTLITQPSGRLARSRRKANKKDQDDSSAPTSTSTQPVPIPNRRTPPTPTRPSHQMSRSAPMSSPNIHRPTHRRSETVHDPETLPLAEWDASPPSTPKRQHATSWQQTLMENGPRTAPPTSSPTPFIFPNASSTPSRHKRVPSFGDVFSFPFDEDQVADNSEHNLDLKTLLASMQLGSSATQSQTQLDRFAYANSSFQNSPNPNDLPPPSLFAGAQA